MKKKKSLLGIEAFPGGCFEYYKDGSVKTVYYKN